jgi:hypothetical protein
MSVKPIGMMAAASLFVAAGVLVCLVRPAETLAVGSLKARQNPTSNATPAQANPSQEIPPAQTQEQNATRNPYRPAGVVSAADVLFPFQTTADGVVVFGVSLGAGSEIKQISVLKDLPPFTSAAEHSLRNWRFTAASLNGQPEDSEMLVAFVFRHAVYIANPPAFTPIFPARESAETRGLIPAGILSVSYAAYPASTIAFGAVVVQANVRPDGSTGGVSVVRDLPGGFGLLATDAAKRWGFQAALRDGRPVPSKVAVAFVFSSRSLNPF